jgi:hypothetical protein
LTHTIANVPTVRDVVVTSLIRFNAVCECVFNAQNPELDTFPKVVEGAMAKYLERASPEKHAKGGTRRLLKVHVRCPA